MDIRRKSLAQAYQELCAVKQHFGKNWYSLKINPGKLVFDELTETDRSTMALLLGWIDNLSEEFQLENIVFTDKTNEKESRKFG